MNRHDSVRQRRTELCRFVAKVCLLTRGGCLKICCLILSKTQPPNPARVGFRKAEKPGKAKKAPGRPKAQATSLARGVVHAGGVWLDHIFKQEEICQNFMKMK